MKLPLLAALTVALAGSTALAAADLRVTFAAPTVHVYESGNYAVTVKNIGNKKASGVTLTVTLPQTGTSPGVSLLGTLGAFDPRCTRSGVTLSCVLNPLNANTQTIVNFNLAIPYSARSLSIVSTAATTSVESGPGVNTVNAPVAPLAYAVAVNAPRTATNLHCTGTASLSSFFECELYPSSISGHTTIFNADNTISFPDEPGYTGTWSQPSASHLSFTYSDGTNTVASFTGAGTNASCFEGVTSFPNSTYRAIYEVCLQ